MTKLNYVNRKSEGLKLGQIVAKDLRKPSKSCSTSSTHKDTNPIELLLDKKALTDDGLAEVARGLEDVLCQNDSGMKKSLALLNLTGNDLTSHSLFELAKTMEAAGEDLLEVDLSANRICITTDEDAFNWTVFLHSLRRCRALRSLNLSGNKFGGARPWEIFARLFTGQFDDNQTLLEHLSDDVDHLETTDLNVIGAMHALSIRTSNGTSTSKTETSYIRGLPSIATLQVVDVGLTDEGALWLSFVLGKHRWIQDRLNARQPVTGENLLKRGFNYASNNCSTVGQKLLKCAEAAIVDPLNTMPPVPENSPMTGRVNSHDTGKPRQFTFTPQHHRRTSHGSADDHDRPSPPHLQGAAEGMESLRRKLQRTQLEESGIRSIRLWYSAVKMLNHVRRIMPALEQPISEVSKPPEPPSEPISPDQSSSERSSPEQPSPESSYQEDSRVDIFRTPSPCPRETYASKLVVDTAEVAGPTFSVGASSTAVAPHIFRHSRARRENFSYHSNSGSPKSVVNAHARAAILRAAIHMTDANEEKIGGLPLKAWTRILGNTCDPEETMSTRQIANVIKWGRDRSTLTMEAEGLGKPMSVQIWWVLEGMGCLSYED